MNIETKLRVTGVSKLEVDYEQTFSKFLEIDSKTAIEVFNIAKSLVKRIDDKHEYVKVEYLNGKSNSIATVYIKTSEYNNSKYANTSI